MGGRGRCGRDQPRCSGTPVRSARRGSASGWARRGADSVLGMQLSRAVRLVIYAIVLSACDPVVPAQVAAPSQSFVAYLAGFGQAFTPGDPPPRSVGPDAVLAWLATNDFPPFSSPGHRVDRPIFEAGHFVRQMWSGRSDSNARPPEPHSGALPGCATPRGGRVYQTGTVRQARLGRPSGCAALRPCGLHGCICRAAGSSRPTSPSPVRGVGLDRSRWADQRGARDQVRRARRAGASGRCPRSRSHDEAPDECQGAPRGG